MEAEVKRMKVKKGWGLFRLGLKRRKKETRRLKIMAAICVLFLSFMLLFQENMNGVQGRVNDDKYGAWFLRTASDKFEDHPYLAEQGYTLRGSSLLSGKSSAELQTGEPGENEVSYEAYLEAKQKGEDEVAQAFVDQHRGHSSRACYLGAFSKGFAEVNQVSLLSGRWPEAPDEIVMSIPALSNYGCSTELGQEVGFYTLLSESAPYTDFALGREKHDDLFVPVSFRLVGVIETYQEVWDSADTADLPELIVTEEALSALGMATIKNTFYTLTPAYAGFDRFGAASELAEAISGNESFGTALENNLFAQLGTRETLNFYALNRVAYENTFWGSAKTLHWMTALLIAVGAAASAYLYAVYLSGRRTYFMRLREIGASGTEVWKMAAYECVVAVLPAGALTLLLSFPLTAAVTAVVSKASGVPFGFTASPKTVASILVSLLLVLAFALLGAAAALGGKRLTQKRQGMKKGTVRALRRRANALHKHNKPALGPSETLRREKKLRALPTLALRLVSVAAAFAVLFCAVKIFDEGKIYHAALQLPAFTADRGDYVQKWTASIPVFPYKDMRNPSWMKDTSTHSEEMIGYTTRKTFSEETVKEIFAVPGVKGGAAMLEDGLHVISWENKENDPYYLWYCEQHAKAYGSNQIDVSNPKIEKYYELIENAHYLTICRENVTETFEGTIDKTVYDPEAFARGEQVFAALDKNGNSFLMVTGGAFDPPPPTEHASIRIGDTITVETKGEPVSAVVAGILYADTFRYHSLVEIFASPAFGFRIQEADGSPRGYNMVELAFTMDAPKLGTTDLLTSVVTRAGGSYFDRAEHNEMQRKTYLRSWFTYGVFALVLFTVFLAAAAAAEEERRALLSGKLLRERRLGASPEALKKAMRFDALKESLWGLSSLALWIVPVALKGREYVRQGLDSLRFGPVWFFDLGAALTGEKDVFGLVLRYIPKDYPYLPAMIVAVIFTAALFLLRARRLNLGGDNNDER